MNALNRYGPLAGRILIALIFLWAGYGKIAHFEGTVGYIARSGVPLPQIALIGAIIVELGGGIMLVLGWKTRWAAAAIIVFTALAALFFHNFWSAPPEQVQNHLAHFMKNVAIIGGLLFVVIHGGGPLSLDQRQKK